MNEDEWITLFFAAIETLAGAPQVWRLGDYRRRIDNIDFTVECNGRNVAAIWTEITTNGGISPNTGVREATLSDDAREVAGDVDSQIRRQIGYLRRNADQP